MFSRTKAYKGIAYALVSFILATALFLPMTRLRAQAYSDVNIKAAYIYKLGKFVTWAGQKHMPINFCYMESSRLAEEESVGRSFARFVKGKSAEWRVHEIRNAGALENCDILFISESEESALESVLSKAADKDILTISDAKRFIYKDGMLGFILDDQNRVKMEANLKNIKKTGVMVGAVVLELMQEVVR